MKKTLLFTFLTLLLQSSFAQDQIVKINGDEIPARVLEITLKEVLYQHPDSLQGKKRSIPRSEVFMIRYDSGYNEVFSYNQLQQSQPPSSYLTPEEMYLQGRRDAHLHYKGTGALLGSAVSAFFFPYGYAGSIAIAFIRPKAHKHPLPDMTFISDPDYVRGYEDKAHSKKKAKAAFGAGIGTVAIYITALIINANR